MEYPGFQDDKVRLSVGGYFRVDGPDFFEEILRKPQTSFIELFASV